MYADNRFPHPQDVYARHAIAQALAAAIFRKNDVKFIADVYAEAKKENRLKVLAQRRPA